MEELINEMYGIISDHREDEGFMTTDRIRNWVMQFDPGDRDFVLSETIHLFRQRYISKSNGRKHVKVMIEYLKNKVGCETVKELVEKSCFVNNQAAGKSQKVLLAFLEEILVEDYQTSMEACNGISPQYIIYLDDFLCTGDTLIKKLTDEEDGWFNLPNESGGTNYDAYEKNKATLVLAYLAVHKHASDNIKGRLWHRLGQRNVDRILTVFNQHFVIENNYQDAGCKFNLLYPMEIESAAISACKEQIERKVHAKGKNLDLIEYRTTDRPKEENFFSSPENRNRYERIILLKSIEYYDHVSDKLRARPLGYGNYHDIDFGFGTMIFTWRNVPFNSPMVFWYPYNGCQPLFERIFT